jgi:nicotinamidase-related amidase
VILSGQYPQRILVFGTFFLAVAGALCMKNLSWGDGTDAVQGAKYSLSKRTTIRDCGLWKRSTENVTWQPERVAVIICDVWDYHHSINAVRRLDEMLPTMNALVAKMRSAGSLVIHAPSDCMPHYIKHSARLRAVSVPRRDLPHHIASWNCKLQKELSTTYPLDQSDGGEDDDPEEHKEWSAKLSSLGRNPSLPWAAQNPAIEIDSSKDYISDRGDEVWAILKHHQIEHVVMIGVHTNMCVLGRPFGLRQLVNQGMDVVLVRDLTDCMYNPKRWPYVDHYSGNDLMIAYVENVVCPTITSDQILGGTPVVFRNDSRVKKDLPPHIIEKSEGRNPAWELLAWTKIASEWLDPSGKKVGSDGATNPKTARLRCSLRVPPSAFGKPVVLVHPRIRSAWLNGHPLKSAALTAGPGGFELRSEFTYGNDDANLLVIELDRSNQSQVPVGQETLASPILFVGDRCLTLGGDWQWNPEPTDADTNLPLPAKFALPPAIFYSIEMP